MTDRYKKILSDPSFIKHMKIITEAEKTRKFCCHGFEHITDTARIGYIISLENSLPVSKDMIYAAALLHDIGRAYSDTDMHHSIAGLSAAENILENCGYTSAEIKDIKDAISEHSHDEHTDHTCSSLKSILHKADKLSRQCFCCSAYDKCNWPEEKKNKTLIY